MIRIAGTYEQVSAVREIVNAFVAAPLPPRDPPLQMDAELSGLPRRAEAVVDKLRFAGAMVPSLDWLLYSFVRKEAVGSSQIEGAQATLVDLLMYEAGGKAEAVDDEDVKQVCNYVDALSYARKQMRRSPPFLLGRRPASAQPPSKVRVVAIQELSGIGFLPDDYRSKWRRCPAPIFRKWAVCRTAEFPYPTGAVTTRLARPTDRECPLPDKSVYEAVRNQPRSSPLVHAKQTLIDWHNLC